MSTGRTGLMTGPLGNLRTQPQVLTSSAVPKTAGMTVEKLSVLKMMRSDHTICSSPR